MEHPLASPPATPMRRSPRLFREASRAWILAAPLALLPLSGWGSAQEPALAAEESAGPVLDARKAEHMFNRFGFGATQAELRAVIGLHSGELFDLWLAASQPPTPPEPKHFAYREYGYDANAQEIDGAPILTLPREELLARQVEMRLIDREQFRAYVDDWIRGLVAGRDVLRDRLALFWHGFFPTSSKVVLRRYELILQLHFLRTNALGGFDDLLRGIVRDPAMLGYFDNDTNSKSHPNENFARELMELYSLGVGNYSEVDVREAARTLTGYQGETGFFVFDEELHDFGEKTILGRTGDFDGDDLAELLLRQEACSTYVAWRLLTWMEGVEPDPARLERYALRLRELEYELAPWLRTLAVDPAFFRDEVLGTRVQGPIEYLVSACHRLRIQGRETFIFFAGARAGQQLYNPPSVKGWEEGEAWITSSSLTVRGNCVGLLLGHLQAFLPEGPRDGDLSEEATQRLDRLTRALRARRFEQPRLDEVLRGVLGADADDGPIVHWVAENCLARAPSAATLETLGAELAWCREYYRVEGALLSSPSANEVLCHLAYILLRLPIAQLG